MDFLSTRSLDVGSLVLVKRNGHLEPRFLLSFNATVLSARSKVAAGAPAIVSTPHVKRGMAKFHVSLAGIQSLVHTYLPETWNGGFPAGHIASSSGIRNKRKNE